jgi:hypothetical protein
VQLPSPNLLDPLLNRLEVKEATLYSIGSTLLFYKVAISPLDRNVSIRALLNYGASHTFISTATLRNFGARLPTPQKSSTLRVKMPDRRALFTDTVLRLPIRISS